MAQPDLIGAMGGILLVLCVAIIVYLIARGGKSILPLLLAAGLFSSCVSSHKTYLPPSNAKVAASTKKVTDGASAAHASARAAKTHVEAAQKHNDALLVTGLDLQQKLDAIIKLAPPELQLALAEVKGDATDMQEHADGMKTDLDGAHKKQDETEAFQVKLDQDIAEWKKNMSEYYAGAQTLANNATQERENLIKTQEQLLQQRLWSWLWKIGGGLIILIGIAVVIAWKLGWKFLKL